MFLRFGGHRQAAGVTIEAERLGELRKRLSAHRQRHARAGRSRAAAADRLAARVARNLRRPDRRPGAPRTVRRRESAADLPRVARRSDGGAAQAEGAPPGVARSSRTAAPSAPSPGAPPIARSISRPIALGSSSRIRSSRASIAARRSRSCRSPTCASPRSSRHEMAALRARVRRAHRHRLRRRVVHLLPEETGARAAAAAGRRRPGSHRAERRRPPRPPQGQRGSRHDRLPEHENVRRRPHGLREAAHRLGGRPGLRGVGRQVGEQREVGQCR